MSTRLNWSPGVVAGRKMATGPFSVEIEEDSGLIADAKFGIGYIHRGIEKQLTFMPYSIGSAYAEKVDFIAAPTYALAFVGAVERLAGIEVPRSAQYARVLLLEINRIYSHIFSIAEFSASIGHEPAMQFSLRTMEKYKDLFELYCGSRLGFGAIRLGGVFAEVTEGFLFRTEKALTDTKKYLEELDTLIAHNPLVEQRFRGLAPTGLSKGNAFGLTGPILRAAGVSTDLRFSGGYLIYQELKMEPPPIWTFGDDVWGRFLQKIFEIEQSIGIIGAVIHSLPRGAHAIPVGLDFIAAEGEWLETIEGPRGQINCLVVSEGKKSPVRVKFAPPSLSAVRILPKILRANRVEDLWPVVASLDISISEVDR